jgi:hypothetical protein
MDKKFVDMTDKELLGVARAATRPGTVWFSRQSEVIKGLMTRIKKLSEGTTTKD